MTQQALPAVLSSDRSQRLKGIALICGALFCFACLDAIAKWLTPQIGALPTTFTRYLVSVVLVFLFLNPWTQPGVLVSARPWMQWVRSLLLFGSTISNFLALQHLQLTQTMSIMFLGPLLVALLAGPILGEWVGARRLAAIGVGFVGILIVTRPGFGGVHPAALYSVAGVFCYAFYAILTRILAAHDSSATTMVYSGLGGLLLLIPVVPFVWTWPTTWLAAAMMVLIGAFGAFGHWLLIIAHRLAPAPVLSPFIYSQMIWMILLGWLVFGDLPDRWTLIGGAVVIASGLYLLHRERVTGRVVTNPAAAKPGA
ncbi:MAG: DMT family transporter [Beijerinckiaceae bacterium]